MSVRVEWMSVEWFSCEVVTRGEVIGGNVVTASHALVLAGDEVTVIEGPKESLLGVLRTLQSALDRTEPNATAATYDDNNRCCSCGEHIADPHAPDCPNQRRRHRSELVARRRRRTGRGRTAMTCTWFILCTNPVQGAIVHPILGEVPAWVPAAPSVRGPRSRPFPGRRSRRTR